MATVNLKQIEEEVRASQAAVSRLLDNEDRAKAELSEIIAIPNMKDRFEAAVNLIVESEALAELGKDLADTANRAKKRMEAIAEQIRSGLLDEVKGEGGEVELKNFLLRIRENPPAVIVDKLEDVPKKYRLEPKPIPNWEEWPVDKNAVKQALGKEKVKSILGVHLEVGERLEIKSR